MSRCSGSRLVRSGFQLLHKALWALEDPKIFGALLFWPKVSLASYLINLRLYRLGLTPKTIIDVGANVGQFAIAAANFFPDAEIHSFEPDSKVAERLRQNASRYRGIHVHEMALGDAPGTKPLHVNRDTQVSSLLPLGATRLQAFPQSTVIEDVAVEVRTLDEFAPEIGLQRPVLLKIDVQGYEDRVLRGGSRMLAKVDYVVMETSFDSLYEGEIAFDEAIVLMRQLGFFSRQPLNWHWSPLDGTIIEMDVLFARQAL